MKKTIVGIVAAAALCAPVVAFADNGQLIALYQQLIQILQQELGILQGGSLTISPSSGPAPFTAAFTINNPTGTEAIDFGDGHSTGSNGCAKNSQGFCDLSKPVSHTYQFPGSYKVTLYRGQNGAQTVTTESVTVQ